MLTNSCPSSRYAVSDTISSPMNFVSSPSCHCDAIVAHDCKSTTSTRLRRYEANVLLGPSGPKADSALGLAAGPTAPQPSMPSSQRSKKPARRHSFLLFECWDGES